MAFQDLRWLLDLRVLVAAVVTFQVLASTVIFFKLSSYNKKHAKRVEQARACSSKPSAASLFELPAFRGKAIGNTVSPFESTTWLLTLYEQVKLSVNAVTIFPVRFITCLVTFFGTYLIVLVLQKTGLKRPTRMVISAAGRLILFCFGFIHISVKGKLAPGVGALVSNHCTFLDGLVWITISTPRIFAEKANFAHPVMQVFAKALDIVLFDRSGSESRRAARLTMEKSASDAFEGKSQPILVFPTGTTTNSKVLITFKDGAFAPGLPVQPAILDYRFQHCDPSWVFSGPGTLMLVFRLMCQFYNELHVEFLPVHTPCEEEKEDPHKYARTVQLKIADKLGVPVTEHSVEDLQLQFAAVKANLPAEVGVVGFSGLKDVFSVDATHIKKQMNVFKEMDQSQSGLVGFEEFKASFSRGFHEPSVEQTRLLQEFFSQLTGGEAHLDFRKFLIGLALVNENEKAKGARGSPSKDDVSPKSTPVKSSSTASTTFPLAEIRGRIYAQLAFAAFASEADDRISWDEFRALWNWLHPSGISPAHLEALERSPAKEGAETLRGKLGSFFRKRRSGSDLGNPMFGTETDTIARHVYNQIAGDSATQCTWEQFSTYSEEMPIFVTELRQAFFGRLSSDLSAEGG